MSNKIKNRFFPGDEWLYYKIYCGYKVSDVLLTEIIKPFTEKLIKENYIKKWYFIRFNDPNYHIRFRLELTDKKNIGHIIHEFNNLLQEYIESKSVWSLQIDCYDREIERYGLNTMELAEEVFFNDSIEITNFLAGSKNEDTEIISESKPIFSLKLIDLYLTHFELSDSQKLSFMERLRDSFYKEFDINKDNKKQIEKVYNNHKESIYKQLLDTNNSIINTAIKKNIDKILKVTKQELTPENNVTYLISSFIHMSLNRLYYSNNRIHELVCYDVLWKFYKSKVSRNLQNQH
ncbi:thiopeptide-type bacteriocin biosynthesis protein [Flavobacterium sp. 9]|uniref:thiopeptide-type bacteriocin biosynthesis protein n=1 Tax=Flavobacterium sp. 9 TaxID=2035198 RepID=UPI000C193772|nr:thiopeptide-type bacteriocin biosynthesis protein [Flavobacterium sp. 9]PIF31807.1 thiopeptide-type bacteriocin biosynthesis protein [Flavobacterium sp. 9]